MVKNLRLKFGVCTCWVIGLQSGFSQLALGVMKDTKIGVIGLGYVGLPLAVTASECGWLVIGYDKNEEMVKGLAQGLSHIDDVPTTRLEEALSSNSFKPTTNPADLSDVDICIICVPTPTTDSHEPDLSYVISASISIAQVLKPTCVVVNESTSFPGTLKEKIQKTILEIRGEIGDVAGYVAAPERVDPMNPKYNHANTPRVIGGDNPAQVSRVKAFYSSLGPEVLVVSSPEAAEFSKLIENAFRLVNISFVNELAPYASALGVDLLEVIDAAATKPFGFMKFVPGPGVGGHCIPVDPHYLVNSAKNFGVHLPVLDSAINVNLSVPKKVVEGIVSLLKGKSDSSVLLIGVAYKSGISDTRESPAIPIAQELVKLGYKVFWTDNEVETWGFAQKFNGEEVQLGVALTSSSTEQVVKLATQMKILDCTGRHFHDEQVISYFNS
jgi:UDP-N-acetyl-D-glucosamine dehydrogenase